MAEVAGRGRGRQAVLPAWMTRGVGGTAPTPTSGVGGGRGGIIPLSAATTDLKNKVSSEKKTETKTASVVPHAALSNPPVAVVTASSSSTDKPGSLAASLASRQHVLQKANQHLLKASSNKPQELSSDNQNAQKERRRRSPLPAASATRNHRTQVPKSANRSHPKSTARRSSRSQSSGRSDSPPLRSRLPPLSSPKKRHLSPPPTAKKLAAPKHESKKAVDALKKRKGGETSSSSSSSPPPRPPSRPRETAAAPTTTTSSSRGRQSRKQPRSASSSSRSTSPRLPSGPPAASSRIRGKHPPPPPKPSSSASSPSSERHPKKVKKKKRSSSPNHSKPSAASPGHSSSPSRRKKTDGEAPLQASKRKRQPTTYRRRRSTSSSCSSPTQPPHRRSASPTRSNAALREIGQKRKSRSSSAEQDVSPAARRHAQRSTKQTVNGKDTGKPSKAHRRSTSSQSSVESVSSNEVARTTAAVLCDRLLSLRNMPWKQRASRLKEFTSCFSNDTDFYAEDRDGAPLAFRKLQRRFFLDAPDKVEVTRRLFLEESDVHSFSLDYEYDEDLRQVVLYECRNGKIVRVYLFRDKDKHASPKRAVSLEDVKNSSVYRQVFKYACKKGLNETKAVHHYYDYASEQ